MNNYSFYKKINPKDNKNNSSFSKLENVYNNIPETYGCVENLKKCKGFCCSCQNPQVLLSEFLFVWKKILKNWDILQICDIIRTSMLNYVAGLISKPCIFFNNDSKLCKIHDYRPFSCRIYSIMPEEEFKPRYERMKEQYKNAPGVIIKDQCNLTVTKDNIKITKKNVDDWWDLLVNIENKIGVPKKNINDGEGGSYRTFHDHLLLYLFPEDIMIKLQDVRMSKNTEIQMQVVEEFISRFKKKLI